MKQVKFLLGALVLTMMGSESTYDYFKDQPIWEPGSEGTSVLDREGNSIGAVESVVVENGYTTVNVRVLNV